MNVKQMYAKYEQIRKDGHEMVTVHEVLKDLNNIMWENRARRAK